MSRVRLCLALTVAWCVGATAGVALAAQPANDNYLSSAVLSTPEGRVPGQVTQTVQTAEATVQADLFNPNRDGLPFGGGGAETTRCGPTTFGNTVWWDLVPHVFGSAEIIATGFDTVISVYEFDQRSARIVRSVDCVDANRGAREELALPALQRGRGYTVQVGGALLGATVSSGTLEFTLRFYGDRDRDGIFDEEPDRCLNRPGIQQAGGCPPSLSSQPRVRFARRGGGVEVQLLAVERAPAGARLEARCRRCSLRQSRRVRRAGETVSFPRFAGRTLPAGATVELFVTMPRSRAGRYRFGAIGDYFRYGVRRGAMRRTHTRCLLPGSLTPRRRCT